MVITDELKKEIIAYMESMRGKPHSEFDCYGAVRDLFVRFGFPSAKSSFGNIKRRYVKNVKPDIDAGRDHPRFLDVNMYRYRYGYGPKFHLAIVIQGTKIYQSDLHTGIAIGDDALIEQFKIRVFRHRWIEECY